ncbi:hypothetical protein SARC_02933 [Sphaeroforma arctica JP610]|uniref:DUF3492 domain-containing protein n=1 Tax=Sphaeroforma arctica JP610 TaxID=667725 RepID=A0A0L0G7J2_9EUKA|nr:hypothetical protein SARC_02933 [Sphaeroforma arctica JP610]KNC84851.1 hypothetical protein SARC_02933 [Sphaeroforma arctica JP610]|eukprot:XP_014158753.1 hypothetical protein SARC_02933 [Sphaeroforma arctica JP610]
MNTTDAKFVLGGVCGLLIIICVLLNRRLIFKRGEKSIGPGLVARETTEKTLLPPTAPDVDPKDDKPLPPKPPTIKSFAYYLGTDSPQIRDELNKKVDMVIVRGPGKISGSRSSSTDEKPSSELGMLPDGNLVMLDRSTVVEDDNMMSFPNIVQSKPKERENDVDTMFIVLVDLISLSAEEKTGYEKRFRKRLSDFLSKTGSNNYQGVVFGGINACTGILGVQMVAKLIQSAKLQFPQHLFFMEEGGLVFDHVSDFVNGVILLNPTLDPSGKLRVRLYDKETETYNQFVAKLNTEIAIRTDFFTLACEAVRVPPPAELVANFVSFTEGLGFVGWMTTDVTMQNTNQVRPLALDLMPGGLLGLIDISAVVSCCKAVAAVTKQHSLVLQDSVPSQDWDTFLQELGMDDVIEDYCPEIKFIDPDVWRLDNDMRKVDSRSFQLALAPVDPDFRDWPSNECRGQRPVGEWAHDFKHEDRILASLSFLQGEGHLKNIADVIKLEVVPESFDQFENNVVDATEPSFDELISTLAGLLEEPTPSAQSYLRMCSQTAVQELHVLKAGLMRKVIKVFTADKTVFFYQNNAEDNINSLSIEQQIAHQWERASRFMAMYEDADRLLNIYVASDHPSVAEATLHCYMKYKGFSQSECVIMEHLIEAQANPRTGGDLTVKPRRVGWELANAPREELIELTLNTNVTQRRIRERRELSDAQREVLFQLCEYIAVVSRVRLIDEVSATSRSIAEVKALLHEPKSDVLREMCNMVSSATVNADARQSFVELCTALDEYVKKNTGSSEKEAKAVTKIRYFYRIIHTAFRRVVLRELCLKVQQVNPLPLPDPDQITVNIEMQVSRDKIAFLFGLSSNQLGRILHDYLRGQIVREEIVGLKESTQVESDEDSEESVAFFKRLSSGMFFTVPAMLDVLLILFVQSGIFSSSLMSKNAVNVVNLTFLIVFTVMGGVANSIARVCSYYFSQYSIPLMLASSMRRITGGLLFALFWSVVGGVVVAVITPEAPWWGLMCFFYVFTFSVFFMFMSTLFIMQTGTDFVLKGKGPRAVFIALLLLTVPCIIVVVADKAFHYRFPFDVIFIYYGFMVISTTWLMYSFRSNAEDWLQWPNSIQITKVSSIEEAYSTKVKRPVRRPEESITDHGKRVKRFEKRARTFFMQAVYDRLDKEKKQWFLPSRSYKEGSPMKIVEERCGQTKSEKILMNWYLMRTGQDKPLYASFQWDVLLKQALGEIHKKFSVEKLNRGGLLYDFEGQAILFGWMYFFMIFIDRWCSIFTGNGIFVFIADSAIGIEYSYGIGWATVYMLLSAGTFELNLSSISIAERSWLSVRLGAEKAEQLVESRKAQKHRFYRAELARFFTAISIVCCITTAFMIVLKPSKGIDAYKYYGIGVLSYSGLLLGLFHKLFLAPKEGAINACLFTGIVVGLLVGIVLTIFLGSVWSLSALTAGSWTFGILVMFLYKREIRVHRGVALSPTLMSSGQEWYGVDGVAGEQNVRDRVLKPLLKDRSSRLQIRPDQAIGKQAVEMIRNTAAHYDSLPSVVKSAYPNGARSLSTIADALERGKIKAYMVLHTSLWVDKDPLNAQGYSALSEYDMAKDRLRVFIATPSGGAADIMVQIVAEAIVHEYMESFGMSHNHATVSEILLDDRVRLPQRVSYHIATMNGNALVDVKASFGANVFKEALLLVDVATEWQKVPESIRIFIVDYCLQFYDLVHNVINTQTIDMRQLPSTSNISASDMVMYRSMVGGTPGEELETVESQIESSVARSCLGYELSLRVNEVVDIMLDQLTPQDFFSPHDVLEDTFSDDVSLAYSQWFMYRLNNFFRLTFMAFTADPRIGREMWFGECLPAWLAHLLLPTLHATARHILLRMELTFLLRSKHVQHFLSRTRRGLNREIFNLQNLLSSKPKDPCYIKYYDAEVPLTAFVQPPNAGAVKDAAGLSVPLVDQPLLIHHFQGLHTVVPKATPSIVSTYQRGAKRPRLLKQFLAGEGPQRQGLTVFYHYEPHVPYYPTAAFFFLGNLAAIEDATDELRYMALAYDPKSGNVSAGTLYRTQVGVGKGSLVNEFEARFFYEDNGAGAPITRAFYVSVTEKWSMLVQYAGKVSGEDQPHISYVDYVDPHNIKCRTHYSYTHPLHPTLQTMKLRTGNIAHRKVKVETPLVIKNDPYQLINALPPRGIYHYDMLLTHGLREKRRGNYFGQQWTEFYSRAATTQRKRMELWTLWRSGFIEGAFAMDIDEVFLREEPILKRYWKFRDRGDKAGARDQIDHHLVAISNLVVRDTPNTRTHLQLRISDLQGLGCGGDSSEITSLDVSTDMNRENLQVLSLDSGTWPTGGGGVGSCRRDLIDNLNRVRWTAIAEIGTDSEMVQKGYQAERFVNAIDYVPLWGLDMGTPNQHVLSDQPYGELQLKAKRTTDNIVKRNFIPLLQQLIYGMNQTDFKPYHTTLYANMFVKLHLYFQEFDWLTSWDHEYSRRAWYRTWFQVLNDANRGRFNANHKQKFNNRQPGFNDPDDGAADYYLQLEMPTLEDLDALYELIVRLLFPIAARFPRLSVVHASHHGIQSLLGVISKTMYGSSLIIWDHGVLWRERLLALSTLPPQVMAKFVQIGFVGLTRLSATLAYNAANCVCPCTSIQNVQWEAYLGGGKYSNDTMERMIYRKISPVLNGMDVNRFRIDKSKEKDNPTTVMLSHVNRIKDVLNAIEAAAVIVHEYGLKEYKLLVYGSLDSDPLYANECANAIIALNLAENAFLCGLGNPALVLPQGWVFVNSSVSEGLPLAIGEAGLTGLPVVCTDVGGSREVLSDTTPGETIDPLITYGRIVAPRAPADLARAQLEIMGLLDGVERIVDPKYTDDDVKLEDIRHDHSQLLGRLMDPRIKAKRRRLGLLLRSRVFRVFPISRYLREHEQQIWISALQCQHWDLWQMVQRFVMPRRRDPNRPQEMLEDGEDDIRDDDLSGGLMAFTHATAALAPKVQEIRTEIRSESTEPLNPPAEAVAPSSTPPKVAARPQFLLADADEKDREGMKTIQLPELKAMSNNADTSERSEVARDDDDEDVFFRNLPPTPETSNPTKGSFGAGDYGQTESNLEIVVPDSQKNILGDRYGPIPVRRNTAVLTVTDVSMSEDGEDQVTRPPKIGAPVLPTGDAELVGDVDAALSVERQNTIIQAKQPEDVSAQLGNIVERHRRRKTITDVQGRTKREQSLVAKTLKRNAEHQTPLAMTLREKIQRDEEKAHRRENKSGENLHITRTQSLAHEPATSRSSDPERQPIPPRDYAKDTLHRHRQDDAKK